MRQLHPYWTCRRSHWGAEHIEGEVVIDIAGDGSPATLEQWFGHVNSNRRDPH